LLGCRFSAHLRFLLGPENNAEIRLVIAMQARIGWQTTEVTNDNT
jgi:hypothetical protein